MKEMLINLHFSNFNGNKFVYDGPYILLDRNEKYLVGVHYFHLRIKNKAQLKVNYDLWSLSSNLVDRSPANPKQSISYFATTMGMVNQTWEEFTQTFYPLEVHHLENPEFWVEKIADDQQLEIESALIQLIIKKCSDSQNL